MYARLGPALSTSLALAWVSVAAAQEGAAQEGAAQVAARREAAPRLPRPEPRASATSSAVLSATLLAAFGVGGRFEDSDVNRYGRGLGARVGVSLDRPGVYLGGSLVRFFGDEDGSGEYYTVTLDAEAGYDISLAGGLLFLRPMLALGVAQLATIQPDNAGYPLALHGAPALLLGARRAPLLVSFEARNDVVAGSWSNALTLALGAGAEF
jgi:hypothetical protein